MKTLKEQIKEILDKDECIELDTIIGQITALINDNYVPKDEYKLAEKTIKNQHKAIVSAEKRGHDKAMEEMKDEVYPKDFVEWYITEGQFAYSIGQVPNPLAEAFQYWKNTIKD